MNNCIIVNYSSGMTIVLPIDSKSAMELAIDELVNSSDYIESIYYSTIKKVEDKNEN
tara:strand:- start:113 stop:283 length:171 start_codon:yes stop_codon:yes gene_type:complete